MGLSARVELSPVSLRTPDLQEALADSNQLAMFAISLDGSVSFWNAAAEKVLGWKSEEVLGNRIPNLIARGSGIVRLKRKDGAEIEGPVQSVPVHDSRGAVSGTLTILTSGI
jgi:PAS domain-containing protein